jgi:hypothetical protein
LGICLLSELDDLESELGSCNWIKMSTRHVKGKDSYSKSPTSNWEIYIRYHLWQ